MELPRFRNLKHAFVLDKEEYFAEAAVFAKLTLATKDTFSLKFYALQLLQELTQFHLTDNDPKALVDLEIQRLLFVRAHNVLPIKNELYRSAFEKLEQKYIQHPISTRATDFLNLYLSKNYTCDF